MKAAKDGTKDGLEKTKAAVKRGRSFIRTKSFISQGLWPRKPFHPLTGAPCASYGSSGLVSLGGMGTVSGGTLCKQRTVK